MIIRLTSASMIIAIACYGAAASVHAADAPIGSAALVADSDTVTGGKPLRVALRLTVPAGWHTYWRNPGDAGAATTIDWQLPAGFAAGPLQWPAPQRFVTGPIVSYGYGGDVWLISELRVPADLRPGSHVEIAGTAEWLVCAATCVPELANVKLTLSVVANARSKTRPEFAQAERRLPRPLTAAGYVVDQGDVLLSLPVSGVDPGSEARFFPYSDGLIDDAARQQANWRSTGLTLRIPLDGKPKELPPALDGVIVAGTDAYEIHAELNKPR